jgi:hypothetical protein
MARRVGQLSLDALPIVLEYFKEVSIEQLKEFPVLRGFLAAAEKLAEAEGGRQIEQKIDRVLASGLDAQQGIETLRTDIKLLTELTMLIFQMQLELGEWLTARRPLMPLEAVMEFATEGALTAYRARVALDFLYADHRGIAEAAQAGHVVSLRLDEVYVRPRLITERAADVAREREREIVGLLGSTRAEDLAPDRRVRLEKEYARLTSDRWRPGRSELSGGCSVGEMLGQHRRCVVLGGPGMGKSLLLRHVARVCALGSDDMRERLGWVEAVTPILVSLAAFAEARSSESRLTLRNFIDRLTSERGGEALRQAVDRELQEDRLLLLLDGVDEAPSFTMRSAIVRAVEEFLRDNPACRCVVTSRPYGYIRLAADMPHFQLLNFSSEQVDEFILGWRRAFERWQHPDSPDLEKADSEATALCAEIRQNPRVEELASNPLMLVIVSLISYERLRLPERRVQLYDRAVMTLMHTWNVWRASVKADVGGLQLRYDRLIRVWGAVAVWAHREKPTGAIHRQEMKRQLVSVLEEREIDAEDPAATAESYLNAAVQHAGLLEERGANVFAFWHPTFEEFLAAVDLAIPTGRCAQRLLSLRDNPRWREVILLAVGYVGIVLHDPETATEVVGAIADAGPPLPTEPLLHSRLRLVAACIADDVEVQRHLVDTIIGRLAEVVNEQPHQPFIEAFVSTARAVSLHRPTSNSVAGIALLTNHSDHNVRIEAAKLLSNACDTNQVAREVCTQLVGSEDITVRCHAALGLLRAGQYGNHVWAALAKYDNPFLGTTSAVASFLLERSGNVIDNLAAKLEVDEPSVRHAAAKLLAASGWTDDRLTVSLESILAADDPEIRHDAARLLVQMGRATEQAVATLKASLPGVHHVMPDDTVLLLIRTGHMDEEVIAAVAAGVILTGLRALPQTNQVLCQRLLCELGQNDQRIVVRLHDCLVADDPHVRFGAACLLIQMGHADERVVAALALSVGGGGAFLRAEGSRLAKDLVTANEQVMMALDAGLDSDDAHRRYGTALMLAEEGPTNERVIAALEAILTAADPLIRGHAAIFLWDLGRRDERVVVAVEASLDADDQLLCLESALRLIVSHRTDERIVMALIDPPVRSLEQWSLESGVPMAASLYAFAYEAGQAAAVVSGARRRLTQGGEPKSAIVAALVANLHSANPRSRFNAATLLIELESASSKAIDVVLDEVMIEETAHDIPALHRFPQALRLRTVRRLCEFIDGEPWVALAAWQRVLNSEALRVEDGRALADLTRRRPDDTGAAMAARSCLFRWLLEYLEPTV